jgi:hypothetical protein
LAEKWGRVVLEQGGSLLFRSPGLNQITAQKLKTQANPSSFIVQGGTIPI